VGLLAAGCTEPGSSPAALSTVQQPTESPAFFQAAVEYLAAGERGPVIVDPRPLRPGADLRHVGMEDLAAHAEATVRLRLDVLAARGIRATDAVAD
jgi:hypothetical protein